MAVDLNALCADLRAEGDILMETLGNLTPAQWALDTPAQGWTIGDQVGHLAYFDAAAALAVTDPEKFRVEAERAMDLGEDFARVIAMRYRQWTGVELLEWWRRTRSHLLEVFAESPTGKLPWYGPPMSPASSLTARIMETWAHGLDVTDALGVPPSESARLRHIAHLGYATIGWSFAVNQLRPAPEPFRLNLVGPDGDTWVWGPEDSQNVISGSALDFCLLVTQRRHLDDLRLGVRGEQALTYVRVAQAFAGPVGAGRHPLQEA